MPHVIVPAGMMMGEYHRPGSTEEVPEHWHINLGGYAELLTLEELTVWAAASLDPNRQAQLGGTRTVLCQAVVELDEARVPKPTSVVDELLRRGLLVEFDPVDGDIETFARRYRLIPTGTGLGNSHDDPLTYRIGVGGEPRVHVNGDVYALWANTFYYPSIWESAVNFAKEMADYAPQAADEGTPQVDPESVARALAANLPLLVSAETAVLDPIVN